MRFSRLTIIPAYNEENSIESVIANCLSFSEVLVIDDGSNDDTKSISSRAGAKVISHKNNLGYQKAIQTGVEYFLEHKRFEKVVFLDADGEISPLCAEQMHSLISENLQVAVGYRKLKVRKLERLITYIIRKKFEINDVLCGCKGFHRVALFGYNSHDISSHIFTFFVIRLAQNGKRIGNVEIFGKKRNDRSRFGGVFRANGKLFMLFFEVILKVFIVARFESKT